MSNPLLVPPRTEEVMLYRPGVEPRLTDLREQLNQALVDLDQARADADAPGASPRGRMNKPSLVRQLTKKTEDLAAKYDELAKQAKEDRVRLLFREVSEDRYRDLRDDHPPRDRNATDQRLGYNADTFPDVLVRACLVEPVVTDEQWEEFRHGRPADPDAEPGTPEAEEVPGVSLFNWTKISNTVFELCNSEPALPNPSAVSSLRRMTERASRRQRATASRPADSAE